MAFSEYIDKETVKAFMERKPNLDELRPIRDRFVAILKAKEPWRTRGSIYGSYDIAETETHNFVLNIHNLNNSFHQRTKDCAHCYMLVNPSDPLGYKIRSAEHGRKLYLRSDLTEDEKVEFDAMAANALIELYEDGCYSYHYMVHTIWSQRFVMKTVWTDDLTEKPI